MANIDNVQLPDGSSYNIVDNTSGFATQNYVDSAVSSVTKTTIGLGNVDNTSDLNKPISTATQTALDTLDEGKADKTDIATVESGTTASRAYSVGELVYVSGTLYRVKTAIASGATFTVGTNIEVTSISEQIDSLKSYESVYNLNADDGFQTANLTQYDELFIRFRDNNNGIYTQAHFYVPLLVTGDNHQNRFVISLNDAPAFGYLTLTSSHFKVYVPLATAKINIYGKKIK